MGTNFIYDNELFLSQCGCFCLQAFLPGILAIGNFWYWYGGCPQTFYYSCLFDKKLKIQSFVVDFLAGRNLQVPRFFRFTNAQGKSIFENNIEVKMGLVSYERRNSWQCQCRRRFKGSPFIEWREWVFPQSRCSWVKVLEIKDILRHEFFGLQVQHVLAWL